MFRKAEIQEQQTEVKMKRDKKYKLFLRAIEAFDIGYDLAFEYDSVPHYICGEILYQAEAHVVQYIGQHEKSTTTELAAATKKTPSACSQIIKKLIKKELVQQRRNPQNKREFFLELTAHGWEIFQAHELFDSECFHSNFLHIQYITEEQLETYIQVQNTINAAFEENVKNIKSELGQR